MTGPWCGLFVWRWEAPWYTVLLGLQSSCVGEHPSMTYFTCSVDLVSLASFTVVVNSIVLIFPSILIKKHAFFSWSDLIYA